MKLKHLLVRISSCVLATTMLISMVGCGSKDGKKEEEDKKTEVEKTVDELLDEMSANTSALSTDKIEAALEDGYLTYEEYEDAIKSISSTKAEGKFELDLSMYMKCDCQFCQGESLDEDITATCTYSMEYDSTNMSFHYGMTMNYMGSDFEADIWLINEDGTYYAYEYDSESGVTYRTEYGNLKETFGENGISKEDLDALYEEFKTEFENEFGFFPSTEDMDESGLMDDIKDHMDLADEYVEHAGQNCYDLAMNLNANDIISILDESGELQTILEAFGLGSEVDDLLSIDVSSNVSVKDICNILDFDVNYYIDPSDLLVTHMEADFSDVVKDSLELTEKAIKDFYYGHDLDIEFKCNKANIYYDVDNNADVSVSFDGEYEEY